MHHLMFGLSCSRSTMCAPYNILRYVTLPQLTFSFHLLDDILVDYWVDWCRLRPRWRHEGLASLVNNMHWSHDLQFVGVNRMAWVGVESACFQSSRLYNIQMVVERYNVTRFILTLVMSHVLWECLIESILSASTWLWLNTNLKSRCTSCYIFRSLSLSPASQGNLVWMVSHLFFCLIPF